MKMKHKRLGYEKDVPKELVPDYLGTKEWKLLDKEKTFENNKNIHKENTNKQS